MDVHITLKYWIKNNEFHALVDNTKDVKYYILSEKNYEESGEGYTSFDGRTFQLYDDLFIVDGMSSEDFRKFRWFNYKTIGEY